MVIALVLAGVVLLLVLVGLGSVLRTKQREVPTKAARLTASLDTASLEDVRQLARAGHKREAVRLFRQLTGQGLSEAKGAVEMLAGHEAQARRKQGIVLRDVRDADIELQIRSGDLLNAIALYREKNGVGLSEARTAVARWRDRLRAN
jgi:ribosomal protein L7/L12